jgi:hypothetical protein
MLTSIKESTDYKNTPFVKIFEQEVPQKTGFGFGFDPGSLVELEFVLVVEHLD